MLFLSLSKLNIANIKIEPSLWNRTPQTRTHTLSKIQNSDAAALSKKALRKDQSITRKESNQLI